MRLVPWLNGIVSRFQLPALALVCAACTDAVEPHGSVNPAPALASANVEGLPQDAGVSAGLDATFARIAIKVPSFAGAYFRGDTMMIRTTLLADSTALKAELLLEWRANAATDKRTPAEVSERMGRLPSLHRFEEAGVSFSALYLWRKQMFSPLFALDGVVSLDIDERDGMIDVGVQSVETEILVRQLASVRALPPNTLRIRTVKPVQESRQTLTLTSRRRPLTGGYEINVSSGGQCTMTTTVYRGVEALILTAGHCSRQRYAVDNGSLSQGNAADPFGYEVTDPSPYSCGTLFQPRRCRHADVAAYGLGNPTPFPDDTATFISGLIGRPIQSLPGTNMTAGSTEINTSSPHFSLLAAVYQPYVGQFVNKVGKSGGWTYGEVYQTCVDLKQELTQVVIVCSDKA